MTSPIEPRTRKHWKKKLLHDDGLVGVDPGSPLITTIANAQATQPTRVTHVSPLTTAMTLVGTPVTPRSQLPFKGNQAVPPSTARAESLLSNTAASGVGGPPYFPPLIPLSDQFQPAVGVYILAASTGAGKTVSSTALTIWANSVGVPSSYMCTFEPRSPIYSIGTSKLFVDPLSYCNDITRTLLTTNKNTKRIIVLDSITMPMKAYASNRAFRTQSTFVGGSQPSDYGFLDALSAIAQEWNTCFICCVNSIRIPYATNLEGSVEGLIKVVDVANMTVSDRTSYSGRVGMALSVPIEFVNMALAIFNLGTYRPRHGRVSSGSRAGIYVRFPNL